LLNAGRRVTLKRSLADELPTSIGFVQGVANHGEWYHEGLTGANTVSAASAF
jgi:hypothetical protein